MKPTLYKIARDIPNCLKRDVPLKAAIKIAASRNGFGAGDLDRSLKELDIVNDSGGYCIDDSETLGSALLKMTGGNPEQTAGVAGTGGWWSFRFRMLMPPPAKPARSWPAPKQDRQTADQLALL